MQGAPAAPSAVPPTHGHAAHCSPDRAAPPFNRASPPLPPTPHRSAPPRPAPPRPAPPQDDLLRTAVAAHGERNWREIARALNGRTDVQCLHRWQKVLRPGIVKGGWSEEEDRRLTELVAQLGTKAWAKIADRLPGRLGKQCRERCVAAWRRGGRAG